MCHEDGELYWHDPDPRAIFPLDEIRPNARLKRQLRTEGFRITMDKAFNAVITACADREETWIDPRIIASYQSLHEAGFAHSVETWRDGELVGGIYGVGLKGAFFGESMFSRVDHASKAAFYALVERLKVNDFVLFDSQYINPFTRQLGAIEIPRTEFRKRLAHALSDPMID
ncbi:MAG: leucyl/phenylalanyl-tRNA--protein transferase [Flavobacteriales bacterium]|nr:leucyl/phenylalanyl-tRNA--protein transferase [Flavobacteriales bacterium]